MVYNPNQSQKETNWEKKEARDIFTRICMTYIAKSGADKDPVIDKIMPLAQQIVDEAFRLYPATEETEKPL